MFPPWVASRAGQVWALVCCCIADMGCAFQGLGWEAQGGVLLLVPLSAVAQPCISPLNWGTFVNLQQNSRTCPETEAGHTSLSSKRLALHAPPLPAHFGGSSSQLPCGLTHLALALWQRC